MQVIEESPYEYEEHEDCFRYCIMENIDQIEQNMSIFFNIASLFRCQDFTITPEQFADNAKNYLKWSAKEDT